MDGACEDLQARDFQVGELGDPAAPAAVAEEIPVSDAAASLTSHPAAQKELELPTNA